MSSRAPEHGPPATAAELEAIDHFAREVVAHVTEGDPTSLDDLLPLVYEEFRGLAGYLLRGERANHTLRPTALANEAYLRLARESRARIQTRGHLLALAATTMRRVLIDYARAHRAERRGGDRQRVSLHASLVDPGATPIDALDLDRALERLGAEDARKLRVVELVYIGGLTFEETAEVLEVSSRTVLRDWRFAKSWLWRELTRGAGGASSP